MTTFMTDKKIDNAFKKNCKIGNNCSVEVEDKIYIGKDVEIGDNCHIKTKDLILDDMVKIGNNFNAVTPILHIGKVNMIGDDVIIGGGGAWEKNSIFKSLDNCLISSQCLINCGEGVYLGKNTALSPRVQIYNHDFWQNPLEGYTPSFGPVEIGNNVHIGGNTLIAPNTTIGNGVKTLGNSLVYGTIEERTLIGGVPAKRIRKIRTLNIEQKRELANKIYRELEEFLEGKEWFTEKYGISKYNPNTLNFLLWVDKGKCLIFSFIEKKIMMRKEQKHISLSEEIQKDRVYNEIRNFLRRKGIKFTEPLLWRYTLDKDKYNG